MMEHSKDVVKTTIATYEKLASHYTAQYTDRTPYQPLYNYFLTHLGGKKVLDVGCGPGHDAAFFTTKGLEVTGVDMSDNLLSFAVKSAPKAKFSNMDMRALEFPPNAFDGLWVMASFQHLPKKDAHKTLAGFRNVLKDSGLLYLSVTEGVEEGMKSKERYLGNSKYFAHYSEAEITGLLTDVGFTTLKIMRAKTPRQNVFMDIFARPIV
ncbi:MAG: class I SAM-dependent methyltransferase [bacterium]|nr:class I SAM-dependent methyltransferase [bacterium]